jgi:hypothetical protein
MKREKKQEERRKMFSIPSYLEVPGLNIAPETGSAKVLRRRHQSLHARARRVRGYFE